MVEAVRDRVEVSSHGETWHVTAGSFDDALAYARERFDAPVVLSRRDRGRWWPRVTLEVTEDPAYAASAPSLEELAHPAAPVEAPVADAPEVVVVDDRVTRAATVLEEIVRPRCAATPEHAAPVLEEMFARQDGPLPAGAHRVPRSSAGATTASRGQPRAMTQKRLPSVSSSTATAPSDSTSEAPRRGQPLDLGGRVVGVQVDVDPGLVPGVGGAQHQGELRPGRAVVGDQDRPALVGLLARAVAQRLLPELARAGQLVDADDDGSEGQHGPRLRRSASIFPVRG